MNKTDVRKGFWRLSMVILGLALLIASSSWIWMEGRVQKHQERIELLGMSYEVVVDSIGVLQSSIDSLTKENGRMHEHLDKSDMDDLIRDISELISFIEKLPERTTSSSLIIQVSKAKGLELKLHTPSGKDLLNEYAGALAKVAGHVGEMESAAKAASGKGGPSASGGGGGGGPLSIQTDPLKVVKDRSDDQGPTEDCAELKKRLSTIEDEWHESIKYMRSKNYVKETREDSGYEIRNIGRDNIAVINYLHLLYQIKPMDVAPPKRRK